MQIRSFGEKLLILGTRVRSEKHDLNHPTFFNECLEPKDETFKGETLKQIRGGKITILSEKILQTKSGNSTIIAMDHGLVYGALEGFKNPEFTLDKVLGGDPNGILAGPNFLLQYREKLRSKPNLTKIATCDFISLSTIPGEKEDKEIQDKLFSIKEALKNGADAVKFALIFGRENSKVFQNNVRYIAEYAEEARGLEIPLVVEPILMGKKIDKKTDPKLIENAVRIAFELGADVIKAPYTGDEDTFEPIVRNCPVPILILGGPKVETNVEVLEMVRGAINAGARGVIFGRNVWQRREPNKIIKAINMIVNKNASVESASKVL